MSARALVPGLPGPQAGRLPWTSSHKGVHDLVGALARNFVHIPSREVSPQVVYAIVRAGGRQEKVSVGDLVTLDRVAGEAGSTIELPVLMLVDGEKVTADAKSLASAKVTAEKVEDLRGPKIVIQKYKNKTGYKKRQGFRAELTTVKITAINA